MCQSVQGNQQACHADGTPGQPDVKRYRIMFWCDGYGADMCESKDQYEAEDWFFDCYQRYDQNDTHRIVRIDNLGVPKDDQPMEKLPDAEFLAQGKVVKEAHLAWERSRLAQQDLSGQQHDCAE